MKSFGGMKAGTKGLVPGRDESRDGLTRKLPGQRETVAHGAISALTKEPVAGVPSSASPSLPRSLMLGAGVVALLVAASAASVYVKSRGAISAGKSIESVAVEAPREREAIASVVAPVAEVAERSAAPVELASAVTPRPATPPPTAGSRPGSIGPAPAVAVPAHPQQAPAPAADATAALTRWEYVGPLGIPQRHYTFLATTRSGLFAATFNNSSQDGVGSEVYFLVPRTRSERLVISVPAKPFAGFSGLAVDEPNDAVFVCLDQGSPTESAVYRFTLGGPPAERFGTGGRLVLNHRPLGCAVSAGVLYVLVDWGFVLKLDPATGAQQGTPIELQSGHFLRDIAINGDVLAAYGNGSYVEYNLPGASVVARKQVLAKSTPRATEGIGMNPASGEFIVRPIDTPDLLTIRHGEMLSTPVEATQLSRHAVDFACAPDGSALFVSDLLRKEIIRYRRSAPRSAAVTSTGQATTSTVEP